MTALELARLPLASWRSPLPDRYVTSSLAGVGGGIKQRPEDFRVDELPLYAATGSGEHLYLTIEKRSRPTLEVVRDVARYFGVRMNDVGYAGMKDKQAVTTQRLSVRSNDDRAADRLSVPGVRVLKIERHANKLRVGHLRGNRFVVRIRGTADLSGAARRASDILASLESRGVPNFFGAQRFGFHLMNHEVGRQYLLRDWAGVCRAILGPVPDPTPDDAPARAAFASGDLKAAAALWSDKHLIERTLARLLANGATDQYAVNQIQYAQRTFFVTAFQSALFNHALAQRIEAGALESLVVGDVAYLHRNGALFDVTDEEIASSDLMSRVASREVSPSGPLWGPEMKRAAGPVDELESRLLTESGLSLADMARPPVHAPGARRSFRIFPAGISVKTGVDEFGPFLGVAFELPPGSFATTVLAEILKPAPRFHPWGSE